MCSRYSGFSKRTLRRRKLAACAKFRRSAARLDVAAVGPLITQSLAAAAADDDGGQRLISQPNISIAPNALPPLPILVESNNKLDSFEHDFVQVAVKHQLGRVVVNDICYTYSDFVDLIY